MKKMISILLLAGLTQYCTAQVNEPVKLKPVNQAQISARAIPANRAVVIRKDLAVVRSQAQQLKDSMDLSKKQLDELIASIKSDMDSMGEMSETESLRLQMAMDRMNKMMSTLSNLMKKMADSSKSIIENMK